MANTKTATGKSMVVRYQKWGYIFLIPFFVIYLVFSLFPLLSTFYYSFFERYLDGLEEIGPNFVGLANYGKLFSDSRLITYTGNTFILWIAGFIPQIIISLLFASWFTNVRLRLKHQGFFKTVIYLPNLIMASAFAMLFFALFSTDGPLNVILIKMGIIEEKMSIMDTIWGTRTLVATMNFLMWFGNTTILLMAGMMGIDVGLFEAAEVDGASSGQIFWKITMPLLRPILLYVVITSMIGGIQMFDVPQVLTNGYGTPNNCATTVIMYLNQHLFSENYGMAGALSLVLFVITAILSFLVFRMNTATDRSAKLEKKYREGGKKNG